MSVMTEICLLRHGESLWNKENRFTGWVDVPLTANGEKQAENAGNLIKNSGINFNVAYTSVLTRAIDTLNIVMKYTGKIPVIYPKRRDICSVYAIVYYCGIKL